MDPELPRSLAGRYRAERMLGGGGFGRVILAHDRELDRRVAIKLLRDSLPDLESRRRFEREARLTAGLRHPGVVAVYDFGAEAGGSSWIVYEYLSGRSVEDWLREHGPGDDERVRLWGAILARALAAVHAAGLVHRDVKPGNVVLREDRDPVLCDFGIARPVEGSTALTLRGLVLGTPPYLAPEVILGAPPDAAADQFALGVTLHELRTGRGVYPGAGVEAIVAAAQAPGPLLVADPGDPLGAVLARSVARAPADRFPDLDRFAAALDTLEEGRESGATLVVPSPGRAAPSPAGDPPRRRALSLVLPALAVAAGLLLCGIPATRVSDPPTQVRPLPAPAGETGPGVAAPAARPALDDLLVDIGKPAGLEPWLWLEPILERDRGRMAEALPELLARAAPSPLGDALSLRHAEIRGRWTSAVLALVEKGLDADPIATWQEGLRAVTALSTVFSLGTGDGYGARFVTRSGMLALRDRIEHGSEAWRRASMVLFWDLLARRLELRPDLNLQALELADRAFAELDDPTRLPPVLAMLATVAVTRAARYLDGAERCSLLSDDLGPGLLATVARAPDAQDYWSGLLKEELVKLRDFYGIETPALRLPLANDRLPLRPGEPGGGSIGPTVPEPRARRTIAVAWRDGDDPVRPLVRQGREALRHGLELEFPPGYPAVLVRALPGEDLADRVQRFPALAWEVSRRLRELGEDQREFQVLRHAVKVAQIHAHTVTFPRRWFGGVRARLRLRLLEVSRTHDPESAWRSALAWTDAWRTLPSPWTESETSAHRDLERLLAGWGPHPVSRE